MKTKNVISAQWHREKIARDTVANPMKCLLGGPTESESLEFLASIGYTPEDLKRLQAKGCTK